MNKINILVVPSDLHGVGTFRFLEPHIEIQKQFPDEFNIHFAKEKVDFYNTEYLDKFQIIFGNKDMLSLEQARIVFPQLQEKGIKLILDLDDHWNLAPSHPQYRFAKESKYSERITEFIPLFDYVTTTTEFFSDEIKKYNKNVVIFPNGVDPTNRKYKIIESKTDKVRIGWLGGSSHLEDLKLLQGMFTSINQRYKDKIQTVLCGFDTRGMMTEVDKETGRQFQRPFHPKEVCWYDFEKIFTSNYVNVPKDYFDWLMKFKQEEYPNIDNQVYRRVWTKPLSTYSLNYNLFDISLAPLTNTQFNLSKSQLKVIESGFFKKPIIATEIGPYKIDIKHGENGFLVKTGSQTKDWAYYAKKLIDNPELAKEMGENLYQTVKDKYDIRNIAKNRAEWFKTIL